MSIDQHRRPAAAAALTTAVESAFIGCARSPGAVVRRCACAFVQVPTHACVPFNETPARCAQAILYTVTTCGRVRASSYICWISDPKMTRDRLIFRAHAHSLVKYPRSSQATNNEECVCLRQLNSNLSSVSVCIRIDYIVSTTTTSTMPSLPTSIVHPPKTISVSFECALTCRRIECRGCGARQ